MEQAVGQALPKRPLRLERASFSHQREGMKALRHMQKHMEDPSTNGNADGTSEKVFSKQLGMNQAGFTTQLATHPSTGMQTIPGICPPTMLSDSSMQPGSSTQPGAGQMLTTATGRTRLKVIKTDQS